MRHGFHYTPCQRRSGFPLLLIAGAVAAVVFWPTVAAVAVTVALVVKLTLIALAAVAVTSAAVAVGVAIRRRGRREPSASVVAVRPARRSAPDQIQLVSEQLAALTAAVERLADQPHPALPAPTPTVVIDQQALAALLAGLPRLTSNDHPPQLARRGDPR